VTDHRDSPAAELPQQTGEPRQEFGIKRFH
jgi:hypothetical protein